MGLTRALWYQKDTRWIDSNRAIKTIKGTEIYLLERYTNLSASGLLKRAGGYHGRQLFEVCIALRRECSAVGVYLGIGSDEKWTRNF